MTDDPPRRRHGVLRSFLAGGILGAVATVVAAPRLRRPRGGAGPHHVDGLEAFEGAPCWEHDRRRGAGERPG